VGVRLVLGKAGTGKTSLCIGEMRGAMREEPLGAALLLITPEQGTFTAERMLLTEARSQKPEEKTEGGKTRAGNGSFRAQVLGFRRLALLIARERGLIVGKPVEDLARLVMLEEIVRSRKEELTIFKGVAERAGFVEQLDRTLGELRQFGHTRLTIDTLIGEIQGEKKTPDTRTRVLIGKLRDLGVLLESYSAGLEKNKDWDFEQVSVEAAKHAGETKLLAGAQVWVDGFSAFNSLEMNLFKAVAQAAARVTLTICVDPDARAVRELRDTVDPKKWRERPAGFGAFARTERMHRRVVSMLADEKIRIEGTTALRSQWRFADAPALQQVDRVVTGTAREAVAADGAVALWSCSDPETEVRAAARWVRERVIGGTGWRYRDIAVIVPDLEGYADAVGRVFAEHNVPHFVDQRRTVAHHPLVELLRSAVAIVQNDWARDDALIFLKTGLAGVDDADVHLLENYLLAHGIDHRPWGDAWRFFSPNVDEDAVEDATEREQEILQRVNAARAKVWGDISATIGRDKAKEHGAAWVAALRGLIKRLDLETKLNALIKAASEAREAELVQIHTQVWRQVMDAGGVLDTLERLLSDKAGDVETFARLLGRALESLSLGLIPPTVDQVLVSSVQRGRVPEVRAVIVLGAIEGQMPKVVTEDPVLNDTQRETMNESSEFAIGGGADRQLLEMPFFDYVALTRAREMLIVSCPVADREGKAVRPSRYIGMLREAFKIEPVKFDVLEREKLEHAGTVDEVVTGVAAWVRDGAKDGAALAEGLYNWAVKQGDAVIANTLGRVWPALTGRAEPTLDAAVAATFYPADHDLKMSVSQLEKFAACPLQYFFTYTMGLVDREQISLDTLSLGILQHRILEQVYRRIIRGELPTWPKCEETDLRGLLEAEAARACDELHKELKTLEPGYEAMRRRVVKSLGIVLESQRRRACVGEFRPAGVEVSFGSTKPTKDKPTIALPVYEVITPGGRSVKLRGKIDRLDLSNMGAGSDAAVVDYKSSSSRKLELDKVYYGIELQLLVYAIVIQKLAQKKAAATMYVPLGVTRRTKSSKDEFGEAGNDDFYAQYKPAGMMRFSAKGQLDANLDDGTKSTWFNAALNKDGSIGRIEFSDLIGDDDFDAVLRYVEHKIAEMADALAAGKIAPAPYQSKKDRPCDGCAYVSVCPFDRIEGAYRQLPKLKRTEAVKRMREAIGEPVPEAPVEKPKRGKKGGAT